YGAGRRIQPLGWVEATLDDPTPGEGDGDGLDDRDELEGEQDRLQHRDRTGARRDAAVAHKADRLVVPLAVEEVEGVLQRSGEAVVVLGRHERERIGRRDPLDPGLGVVVLVVAEP